MRLQVRCRWKMVLGGLIVLSGAGCTITFHSPVRVRTGPEPGTAATVAVPAEPATLAGPRGAILPNAPPNVIPNAPPTPPLPPLPPLPPNEQLSLLLQKLMGTEDDRKVLSAKLQQVDGQLREKDQAVVQASFEIQESSKQIRRTREEMQRWRLEMDEVRTKLRALEKENKLTLEAVLKSLEQITERDREAWRPTPPSEK